MADAPRIVEAEWPQRTWTLAILGALLALAIQQLADLPASGWEWGARIVAAAIALLGFGGLAFGLSWLRGRLVAALVVALACGLLSGGVLLWNGVPGGLFQRASGWHLVCGMVAVGAILTLYQAAQDRHARRPAVWSLPALRDWKRGAIHYADVHGHLWTNVLLVGLGALFTGLSLGIAYLMAEMFWLVKLDVLKAALREDWFNALLCGGAFGAAIGLLRDRGAIILMLQRVAMIVLRVLAPVVAVGIFIFLAALPFTGLDPLWSTGGTTPIMLVGAMLALFLANAVVGDTVEDESRSIILSASAAALGLFLLPMVGIAAFSSGLRIQQYGLSPDRLWALAFIIVASVTAAAYAVAILGTRGWFVRLRRTNLHLVFLLGAVTLLLATPLIGFERIASAHQVARLTGGQVSPENFDYKGLWFDFGPPGREAIQRLAKRSSDATIRRYAAQVQKSGSRWDDGPNDHANETGNALDRRLTILPRPVPLGEALRRRLIRYDACGYPGGACTLRYVPGQDYAVVISDPAPKCDRCKPEIRLLRLVKGDWTEESLGLSVPDDAEAKAAAIRAGRVEMRPVRQRQIFIDGKPSGEAMPLENAAAP